MEAPLAYLRLPVRLMQLRIFSSDQDTWRHGDGLKDQQQFLPLLSTGRGNPMQSHNGILHHPSPHDAIE